METNSVLKIVVKYNCKAKNIGLMGYYIYIKSLTTSAEWEGYADAGCLSWLSDKGEELGIQFDMEMAEDIDLVSVGSEWKLPEGLEADNVYNIDEAFIRGILVNLDNAEIPAINTEEIVEVSVEETKKMEEIIEDSRKRKRTTVPRETEEDWYKADEEVEIEKFEGTEDIAEFMTFINEKINKHNFEFDDISEKELDDIIFDKYFVYCKGEDTELRVNYNKRHRICILSMTLVREKGKLTDNSISFVGFIKDGKLLKGYYLPYYGTVYMETVKMSFLREPKYKIVYKDLKDNQIDDKSCYVFWHTVWLGMQGKHLGRMKYYFDTKDLSFVLRMNYFGGFYKYSFSIK